MTPTRRRRLRDLFLVLVSLVGLLGATTLFSLYPTFSGALELAFGGFALLIAGALALAAAAAGAAYVLLPPPGQDGSDGRIKGAPGSSRERRPDRRVQP